MPRRCHRRLLSVGLLALLVGGCGWKNDAARAKTAVIRVEGSDTMVNLAQAWAERYHEKHRDVSVQVLGGGSGVGIASLIDGNCDLADSSREMKDSEIEEACAKRGTKPVEHVVGFDALAVCVHKDNPIESISLEELADIFGAGGRTTRWSQLGADNGPGVRDRIVRLGRQNSSGTYAYFREVTLGKRRDFKLGSSDMSGSKQVVALTAQTPGAIGYTGMGYVTPQVKTLKISQRRGRPGVAPTAENAKKKTYPITRSLLIYTIGEPTGPVREYLQWLLSPEGQRMVLDMGYVPVAAYE